MRAFWYSGTVSHGFPREKAKWIRLNALARALKWCRRIGVDYVVFEDLTRIKTRKYTCGPSTNRKIAKFPERQMLMYGVFKALKLEFTVIVVDPSGTSNSITHRQIMKEKGLDKHMASVFIAAYRGLKVIRNHER